MATVSTRIRRLASEIAKREGKKSNARIGDIREILAHLADIASETPNDDIGTELDPVQAINDYAEERKQRREKKKKKR